MQSFSQEAGTIPSEESAMAAMKALPDIEGEGYSIWSGNSEHPSTC